MAATTGQQFNNLLYDFESRASAQDCSVVYYSFYPATGVTEFLYNQLKPTGESYLQKIGSVQVTNVGSGYGATEVPNVTFKSLDGGTGASGTAIMQITVDAGEPVKSALMRYFPFSGSNTNLINNFDFSLGPSGWYQYPGDSEMAQSSFLEDYEFISGKFYVKQNLVVGTMYPNSGNLQMSGNLWLWGSMDIADYNTSSCGMFLRKVTSSGAFNISAIYPTGNGTYYFGGYVENATAFKPGFYFLANGIYSVDNLKLYSGNLTTSIVNSTESFTTPSNGAFGAFYPDKERDNYHLSHDRKYLSTSYVTDNNSYPLAKLSSQGNVNTYSLGFWHKLNLTSGYEVENIVLAEWNNFSLEVLNGYYVLVCKAKNLIIETDVAATSGWHQIFVSIESSIPQTESQKETPVSEV